MRGTARSSGEGAHPLVAQGKGSGASAVGAAGPAPVGPGKDGEPPPRQDSAADDVLWYPVAHTAGRLDPVEGPTWLWPHLKATRRRRLVPKTGGPSLESEEHAVHNVRGGDRAPPQAVPMLKAVGEIVRPRCTDGSPDFMRRGTCTG